MLAGAGVGKTPKVEVIGVLGADGEEEDQEKGRSAHGAAVGQGPAPLSPGVARPLSGQWCPGGTPPGTWVTGGANAKALQKDVMDYGDRRPRRKCQGGWSTKPW